MKKVFMILMFMFITAFASISWEKPNVSTNANDIAASYMERGFPSHIMHNGILKVTYDIAPQVDGSYNVIRIFDGVIFMQIPVGFNMNNLSALGLCVTCQCTCCGCGFSTYSYDQYCVRCACSNEHKLLQPHCHNMCGCGICVGVNCDT